MRKHLDNATKNSRETEKVALRRMLIDVHLAEYKALRDLANIQIQQDRAVIAIASTIIGALVGLVGIQMKDLPAGTGLPTSFWVVLSGAAGLLSLLGILNVRAVQAGLEVNAYLVWHLQPSIAKALKGLPDGERLAVMQAEQFFPRVDRLHQLRERRQLWKRPNNRVLAPEGFIRRFSGISRGSLFAIPAGACLFFSGAAVIPPLLDHVFFRVIPDPMLALNAFVFAVGFASFWLMIAIYYVALKQLRVFMRSTRCSITATLSDRAYEIVVEFPS